MNAICVSMMFDWVREPVSGRARRGRGFEETGK